MADIKLRDYQQKAVDSVIGEWRDGHKRTLAVMPTGTGKTVVFSTVLKKVADKGNRALVLAHRGELLEQARDKIYAVTGRECALEKADSTAIGSSELITLGSIQTFAQPTRLERFPRDYFKAIVVDEAHHALSDTYQRVLEHFDEAYVMGATATPDRGDRRALAQYFDSLAFEYNMRDAIRDGYLCPIKAKMIPLDIDITDVGISNGDFALEAVNCALEPYLEQIAQHIANECADRRTVVFLPLIATSQKFRDVLERYGMKAAEVNGNSPDRAEILQDFADGKYQVLCNSLLVLEGWDCPSVDCVVMLRPTKIRSLYTQAVGRGTRLYPGKNELLLLDFLWMTNRHDLCRPSALIAEDADVAAHMNRIVKEQEEVDLTEAELMAKQDVAAEREEALAKMLREQRRKKARLVDPLQWGASIRDVDVMNYMPTFGWEGQPPTEKQLEFISKAGINPDGVTSRGHAGMIINNIMQRRKLKLATAKQIRLLEQNGFAHVGEWKQADATKLIGLIASNNWRVPGWITPEAYVPNGG